MEWKKNKIILSAILVGLGAFWIASWPGNILLEKDSLYNHLIVKDEGGKRILYFNNFPQTTMSLNNPAEGAFEYTEYFQTALAFNPNIQKILVIGLGGGSIPKAFNRYFPHITVHTVEIDPVVVDVAKRYFAITENPRHKIFIEDGRSYLRRTKEKYDAIFLDAYVADYYGAYIPFHLATQEFFTLVKNHLNPGGIIGYNIIGTLFGEQKQIVRAIYKTLSSVFGLTYYFPAESSANVVLFGVNSSDKPTLATIRLTAQELVRIGKITSPNFLDRTYRGMAEPLETLGIPLLQDNYAPVETLPLKR